MGYFPDHTTLYVYNGDTSDEIDINTFVNEVDKSFDVVKGHVDTLYLNQNQAYKWARENEGTIVQENIGGSTIYGFSARAYAEESKRWANEDEDVTVVEWTEGAIPSSTSTEFSAKHYSIKSSDSATTSELSSNKAQKWAEEVEDVEVEVGSYSSLHWASKSEASATEAALSAAQATGSNTITEGTGVTINTTGTGPYNHEITSPLAASAVQPARSVTAGGGLTGGGDLSSNRVISHADTSSQASVNNSGATIIQDITLDGYGHVSSLGSKTMTASDVDALPIAGGTVTGNVTVNGTLSFPNSSGTVRSFIEDTGVTSLISKDSATGYQFGGNGAFSVGLRAGYSVSLSCNYGGGSTLTYNFDTDIGSYGLFPSSTGQILGGNIAGAHEWAWIYLTNAPVVSSDERLKDIGNIGDPSWLYNLNPLTFRWKTDSTKLHYGFSAQETYEVMPDKDSVLVTKPSSDDKGTWGMSPTELIAPMLQLIKDQKTKIEELEARIEVLENVTR